MTNGRTDQTDIGQDESIEILTRGWNTIPAENPRKAWNVI
jgi:hypothetical protein